MTMIYIVPTRERPQNARALLRAWKELTWLADLMFVVDEDDPTRDEYVNVINEEDVGGTYLEFATPSPLRGMVHALNDVAFKLARGDYRYIGFMGDDHRPRTMHWDLLFQTEFERGHWLLIYGNDLVQRANLPTSVVMRAEVIRTLGYMAPPQLRHLYVDNWWKVIARDRIKYMDDVVVEHVHPITGKAQWDDVYKAVNDGSVYAADQAAYERLQDEGTIVEDMDRISKL